MPSRPEMESGRPGGTTPASFQSPTTPRVRPADRKENPAMKKRVISLAAALCLALSLSAPVHAVSYFPAYTGGSVSISAALDTLGVDSSYANRTDIAAANGISGYRGTAGQNTQMLDLLKRGALIDPSAPSDSPFFPAYTGSSPSIASALSALGVDSGYAYRAQIAAANGISGYSGTASQNTALLQLLKQGKLVKPGSAAPASTPAAAGLTAANLGRVSFLRQDTNTCKATSAAMAVNLIVGANRYSTADMIYSGVLCRSLDGEVYTGSDGNTYRVSYKTDSYAGNLSELTAAVDAAVANGLPIVAAVHSSSTRHHWIVIVGRDTDGSYLAVDPARNGSGTMASQARSMTAMGYSFGLTDYTAPHYGWISFQRY